jgi:hypothetical protein
MQLGEWRKAAPNRDCMSNAVLSALKPVLSDLGASADPDCWVEWGDDPQFRYSVMVPTRAGLISAAVRLNAGSDPRVTGKLVRWTRLQTSELSLESSGGHRIVAVQVEGQVLKGTDSDADLVCEFVRGLIAAMDGRDWQFSTDGGSPQAFAAVPQRPAPTRAAAAKQAPKSAAKPAPKSAPKSAAKPAPKAAAKAVIPRPAKVPSEAPAAARAAAPKPVKTTTSKAAAAKPATKPSAEATPKPATRKRNTGTDMVPALGPGIAAAPRPEPAPIELARIAPHPIFAPVASPPARRPEPETEPPEWGEPESGERGDRETRRPKTWTP